MLRLSARRVRNWAFACGITMLHVGCGRFGYDFDSERLSVAGGVGGGSALDPTSFAGTGAGAGRGGASAGGGGRASAGGGGGASGAAGAGLNMAGDGGMAAGGESAQDPFPPLPCATPLVWRTDFSTDPTALDGNGDSQPDWVIRGGAPFVAAELVNGVWRPTDSKALDTFPPFNFIGRTQARVRMRDITQTPSTFSQKGLGGAVFWINLDYNPSDYVAIYGSISTLDAIAHEFDVYAQSFASLDVIAGPLGVAKDAFVVLELDFDPASGVVGVWVDGKRLPAARPIRQTAPNADQFATAIAPQGTGEFDELWVATCAP